MSSMYLPAPALLQVQLPADAPLGGCSVDQMLGFLHVGASDRVLSVLHLAEPQLLQVLGGKPTDWRSLVLSLSFSLTLFVCVLAFQIKIIFKILRFMHEQGLISRDSRICPSLFSCGHSYPCHPQVSLTLRQIE